MSMRTIWLDTWPFRRSLSLWLYKQINVRIYRSTNGIARYEAQQIKMKASWIGFRAETTGDKALKIEADKIQELADDLIHHIVKDW